MRRLDADLLAPEARVGEQIDDGAQVAILREDDAAGPQPRDEVREAGPGRAEQVHVEQGDVDVALERRQRVGEPALVELAHERVAEARDGTAHRRQAAAKRTGAELDAPAPQVAVHLAVGRDAAERVEDDEPAAGEARHQAELRRAAALAAARFHDREPGTSGDPEDAIRHREHLRLGVIGADVVGGGEEAAHQSDAHAQRNG